MSRWLLFLFLVVALCLSHALTSCKKVGGGSSATSAKMEEMSVPDDFDWKTARVVKLAIANLPGGVVKVSSADGKKLYFKGYYSGTPSIFQVAITVATAENSVLINNDVVAIPSTNIVSHTMMNRKSALAGDYAMYFSGNNSFITVPGTVYSSLGLVTMEVWVKLSAQQTSTIIQKGELNGVGLGVDLYNGFQAFALVKGPQKLLINWGARQPILNRWYHLAVTYDGTQLSLYVDGVLKNSTLSSAGLDGTAQQITIGSNGGGQQGFKGWMDDLSVWTIALPANTIAEKMNSHLTGTESGLYAYWPFDEGTGTTAVDKSPLHYDGTINNTTWSSENAASRDTDGDGVQDLNEDYPTDPQRAFNNYFPAGGPGTLVFEDLWPAKGDYDFNDLVVDYQFKTITDSHNKVDEIDGTFIVRAAGAQYENGFGFQLPVLIPAADITVEGFRIFHSITSFNNNGTETGQPKTTIIVFDDVFDLVKGSRTGIGFNTTPGSPFLSTDTIHVVMKFKPETYLMSDIGLENFNPFLIVNKIRGREVHLANYPPTALADLNVFGMSDDNSNVQAGRYFKTKNNLPWALNVIERFSYTKEKEPIINGYHFFSTWAQSNGIEKKDWYIDASGYRDASKIYKP